MAEGLRELLAVFDLKADVGELKEAGKSIIELKETAIKAGEAILGAFAIERVIEFGKGVIEMGEDIAITSEKIGVSTNDLQLFQGAAKLSGLSAEEASTALRFLNKNLGEAALGGGDAAAAFQKLGVHTKDANGKQKELLDIVSDIADGFQKLPDDTQRTTYAMQIFGRAGAGLLPLLKQGSAGIDELYHSVEAAGGVLDEDFIGQAKEAGEKLKLWDMSTTRLKVTFVQEFLPGIISFLEAAQKFTKRVSDIIDKSNILKVGLAALAVVLAVVVVLWAAANIELLLIVLAIGAIILVIEDLYTWLNGGKSVIGEFLDSLFGIGAGKAIADDLKDAWQRLTDLFKDLWQHIKTDLGPAFDDLGKSLGLFGDKKGDVNDFGDALSFVIKQVVGLVHWWELLVEGIAKAVKFQAKFVEGANYVQTGGASAEPGAEQPSTAKTLGHAELTAQSIALGGITDLAVDYLSQKIPQWLGVTNHSQVIVNNHGITGNPDAYGKATKDAVEQAQRQQIDNQNAYGAVGGQ